MKIVTICCDKYKDTPPTFSYLINKAKLPYPIVYVTNKQNLNISEPVYYLKGNDMSFGWRLRQFIKQHYTDEHLLFMMSDYFIKSADLDLVAKAHELCARPEVSHVRLRPMPHPQYPYNDDFGKIDKYSRYCLSLQPGIWRTQVLYDLLRDNENPWQTEVIGSARVKNARGLFLSSHKWAMPHINYYAKGRPQGIEWIKDNVLSELWPKGVK